MKLFYFRYIIYLSYIFLFYAIHFVNFKYFDNTLKAITYVIGYADQYGNGALLNPLN